MARADTTAEAYEELCDRYERVALLDGMSGAGAILRWDQQVTMPEGGTPARARQQSTLSSVRHDYLTDDEVGDLLEDLEGRDLNDEQQAVVREIRYRYDRAVEVPGDLVEELTRTQSESQEVWQEAKARDDFDHFAPKLQAVRDLSVERAEHIDASKSPYEVMFEDSYPHISLDRVEGVFETLREELVPLIEDIEASDVELADPFEGTFDEATQDDLSHDALELLGYDFERGRLDESAHPFTSGNQFDCRVTTRYHEDDPLDALTATIHEFGHATYQLGLPQEHYANPLGEAVGGIHESQSRFWENHVGRTEPFWELFLPTMQEHFPQVEGVTPREAYEAANRIYPENLIRVEADELTYHMHIILRCEIDRAFVEGDLAVDEIPQVWNDKMDEYLDVRPETDAEGCLQDIHWSYGFAGFQSYTVGSVVAAQLDAALREDIDDVDGKIRRGEFEPFHDWMTENVHAHGKRYETDDLIERATGEPLTADYFVDYAKEKFGSLYDL